MPALFILPAIRSTILPDTLPPAERLHYRLPPITKPIQPRRLAYWAVLLLAFMPPAWGLEAEHAEHINHFKHTVMTGDKRAIAELIEFPLERQYPLSHIDTPEAFIRRFDEVFDEVLRTTINHSDIATDWAVVGWRGITLDGMIWLTAEGKVSAVNYQSDWEKTRRRELITADKQRLHPSLHHFKAPILNWQTQRFIIRIDEIDSGDGQAATKQYRYAAWQKHRSPLTQPEVVLTNGKQFFAGSGGNHAFQFTHGNRVYKVSVQVMRAVDSAVGTLEVFENGKRLFTETATVHAKPQHPTQVRNAQECIP